LLYRSQVRFLLAIAVKIVLIVMTALGSQVYVDVRNFTVVDSSPLEAAAPTKRGRRTRTITGTRLNLGPFTLITCKLVLQHRLRAVHKVKTIAVKLASGLLARKLPETVAANLFYAGKHQGE
jgi:hypothetical protein